MRRLFSNIILAVVLLVLASPVDAHNTGGMHGHSEIVIALLAVVILIGTVASVALVYSSRNKR